MSLTVTSKPRPELSESSAIITSSESSSNDEEYNNSYSGTSDISVAVGSVGQDTKQAPTLHGPNASDVNTCPPARCDYTWPALSSMRGAAEFIWHGVGRAINAGVFIVLSNSPASHLRIAASVATGIAAGGCGYRFVASRAGDGACGKALASATGLVTGFAAGTATYYGSGYPGLMLAAAGTISVGMSYVQNASRSSEESAPLAKAVPPALVVAVAGASIAVTVYTPVFRALDLGKLGRRTIALLAEAVTVELFKGVTERMIPGPDRNLLSLERKLKAALIGMLPYALASVTFGGILGNLLRAQMKSDRYENYFVPLLVGALASVVKGAVNTAVLRCHQHLSVCGSDDPAGVRRAEGPRCPPLGITAEKAALRFAIASARDIIYLSLVDSGLDDASSACIAYSLYAFFAQNRELMIDIMQGEGWSEPRINARIEETVA
jgi:hypothetical protein